MKLQRIIDCHHHFLDPVNNEFQSFLHGLGAPSYLPEQYAADCETLCITETVHIEAMPDDGIEEVLWVERMIAERRCKVAAIVAQCDLSLPNVEEYLSALQEASPERLRGVRYILDYDGPYDKNLRNGTHVACSRHNKDYLRDPAVAEAFACGFGKLANFRLSFDLQCSPTQLPAAAKLLCQHPSVPVCIDHMGKPLNLEVNQCLNSEDSFYSLSEETSKRLAVWRHGMKLMAELPQVFVKLSMLGFAVPGWYECDVKESFLKSLVLEVIDLFGAERCMFNSNFHINGAVSDSDGIMDSGPSIVELYNRFHSWVEHVLTANEQELLFFRTAKKFYRI